MNYINVKEKFIYSFDKDLTILNHFKKIKIKSFFKEILFPLNHLISQDNYKAITTNKGNRFHTVNENILKDHFRDVLNKAEDNNIYQIAVDKQKRLFGIIIKNVFYIIGYDPLHING